MGKIRFHKTLADRALEAIKEAHDLSDVREDLDRVRQEMEKVSYSRIIMEPDNNEKLKSLLHARALDDELRRKYPTINQLLFIADKLPKRPSASAIVAAATETSEFTSLEQDYYGILCDTLLRKEITSSIEEFIDRVE